VEEVLAEGTLNGFLQWPLFLVGIANISSRVFFLFATLAYIEIAHFKMNLFFPFHSPLSEQYVIGSWFPSVLNTLVRFCYSDDKK
jgi:hypothetical protein